MTYILPLTAVLLFAVAGASCEPAAESRRGKEDQQAPPQTETSAHGALPTSEDSPPADESTRSLSEILRAARPAPMPHEEPPLGDLPGNRRSGQVVGHGPEAGSTLPVQDDRLLSEVQTLGEELARAIAEADIEAILRLHIDDVTALPDHGLRIDGIEALRERCQEMVTRGFGIRSFSMNPTDAWQSGGQIVVTGTFELSYDSPGLSGAIADKGKYLSVYVRQADGAVKIEAHIWNSDLQPMPQKESQGKLEP